LSLFSSFANDSREQVCYVNYGCDALTDVGCGNNVQTIGSVECAVPEKTLTPFYDCPSVDLGSPAYANASCLVLTGVASGPLGGSLPQFVEAYAACAVLDLSAYGLGRANAGGGGSGGQSYTFPADAVAAGSSVWISAESSQFEAFMGFAPTYANPAATVLSGTEAVELYLEGRVVDRFGEPSYNLTAGGPSWAFANGWAYRASNGTVGLGGDQAFDAGEWTVRAGALVGADANADASSTDAFPAATYAPRPGWNPMAGCAVTTPCSCSVSTDHTAINCTTVPGAGAG
jgi:hypothetical protein